MGDKVNQGIVDVLNKTDFKILVWTSNKEETLHKYGLRDAYLVETLRNCSSTGGESFTFYIYCKVIDKKSEHISQNMIMQQATLPLNEEKQFLNNIQQKPQVFDKVRMWLERSLKCREYKVLEKIGEGSFGKVYKGVSKSNEQVAIKVAQLTKNFQSESQKLMQVQLQIKSQFIISLYDNVLYVNQEIIIMEYHPLTLSKFLKYSKWSLQLLKKLFVCIANGIAACRATGLAHCDIKPANILLTSKLVPKITDFGLAYTVAEKLKGHRGTRQYAAPEVFKPRLTDDGIDYTMADQWSLGVLLYQMIYRKCPFKEPEALCDGFILHFPSTGHGVSDNPIDATELQAANDLIRKLLQYNPNKRLKMITAHPWFKINMMPTFKVNLAFSLDSVNKKNFIELLESVGLKL